MTRTDEATPDVLMRRLHRMREMRTERTAGHSLGGMRAVPLLGETAAGEPLESHFGGSSVEFLEIPERMLRGGKEAFALRVVGESMTGAGILPNDIVILQKQETADNGDIVVVEFCSGGSSQPCATLKRLDRNCDRIRFMPDNPDPAYQPIEVSGRGDFRIVGKMVGLMREWA